MAKNPAAKDSAGKAIKKVKRPTPLKRDEQSLKRCLRNKMIKSRVNTAIRAYDDSLKAGNAEESKTKLNLAYSILDKASQKGIFKQNKSDRTKARLAARAI